MKILKILPTFAFLLFGLAGCLPVIANDCPTLYPGNSNARCVGAMQGKLGALGYMYSTLNTGTYGPTTVDAVKRFQSRFGLVADGIVGPDTRNKINEIQPKDLSNGFGVLEVCNRPTYPIVCANKTSRVAVLMVNGQVQGTSEVRFGGQQGDGSGEVTQEGLFKTQPDWRGPDAISTLYNPPVPIPWFVGFYNGEGFHFSNGFAPGASSHGCVRVRDMNFAQLLWNVAKNYGLDAFIYAT